MGPSSAGAGPSSAGFELSSTFGGREIDEGDDVISSRKKNRVNKIKVTARKMVYRDRTAIVAILEGT